MYSTGLTVLGFSSPHPMYVICGGLTIAEFGYVVAYMSYLDLGRLTEDHVILIERFS